MSSMGLTSNFCGMGRISKFKLAKVVSVYEKASMDFDTRGILSKEEIISLGLNFWSIGQGS